METVILSNPVPELIRAAAHVSGIAHSLIFSNCKTKRVVRVRWALYLTLRRLGFSYNEIGREFGRDHTVTLHGVKQAARLLDTDAWFKALCIHLFKIASPN